MLKKSKYLNIPMIICIILFCISIIILSIFLKQLSNGYSLASQGHFDIDVTNMVGTFIGGIITPIISLIAIILYFTALIMQSKELELQRKELKLQRDELKLQRNELERTSKALEIQSEYTEYKMWSQEFNGLLEDFIFELKLVEFPTISVTKYDLPVKLSENDEKFINIHINKLNKSNIYEFIDYLEKSKEIKIDGYMINIIHGSGVIDVTRQTCTTVYQFINDQFLGGQLLEDVSQDLYKVYERFQTITTMPNIVKYHRYLTKPLSKIISMNLFVCFCNYDTKDTLNNLIKTELFEFIKRYFKPQNINIKL